MRVAHQRTDAMHTAGRIELIHRTSIHSRHGLPAASIPAAGPRSRQLHDIPTLREMQNSRKRLQNNSFDRLAARNGAEWARPIRQCARFNSSDPGHGVRPPGRKPSRDDTMQTCRRVLVHFEDLGAWWPMLDTIWDLTSGSWPQTREGSSWARFWRHDWSARGAFPASR